MVKDVEEWELSKDADIKHEVYVIIFSSAKVKCIIDYVKPCINENNPDHAIIHVGTNELDSERQADMIMKSIVDAAKGIKTNTRTGSISGMVPRNDSFSNKALDFHYELAKMYREAKLDFTTHKKINLRADLNNS